MTVEENEKFFKNEPIETCDPNVQSDLEKSRQEFRKEVQRINVYTPLNLTYQEKDSTKDKDTSWSSLHITGYVHVITASICNWTYLTQLNLSNNRVEFIPEYIGNLYKLEVLNCSNNKIKKLPNSIGKLQSLQQLLAAQNLIIDLPNEIGRLYRLVTMDLDKNPLSENLLKLYNNGKSTHEIINHFMFLMEENSEKPHRKWQDTLHMAVIPENLQTFRILNYNVLSDYIASRYVRYCSKNFSVWENRAKLIYDCIIHFKPDIVCLQEIQGKVYTQEILTNENFQDYITIYMAKLRSRTFNDSRKADVDGCLMMVHRNRFNVLNCYEIDLNVSDFLPTDCIISNQLRLKDNVAIISILHVANNFKHTCPQYIIVANAHLYYQEEEKHIKLMQCVNLLRNIQQVYENFSSEGFEIAVILCGDFNSLPDSPVLNLILKGIVETDNAIIDNSIRELDMRINLLSFIKHKLILQNAYENSYLPFTHFKPGFQATIDYIFTSKNGIRIARKCLGIDPKWFEKNNAIACPNKHIPSDHIPLIIDCY
ncbi:hypothetical protein A3Q56_02208 [Intoshia linei]|uniref:Uncharacterized protein n=1 Tax=Intoshia linei TaxID=1819745 RepID=A0A177B8P3_9BILA|nr:hypothetical protein A3Q56_02208 [Intoshia linei]